jgi:4-amino-4-deoxy-L-arabinose transferase-like glycosyltransferase
MRRSSLFSAATVIPARISLALVALLLVMRAVMAAQLPLSADEAYYWLWSKHLAAGYYDHPPMIAWLIRAGTSLFGDTALGVRLMGVLLSLPASWFVWQAGRLILDDDRAALGLLFFNLTLMISVELLAATPDMPSIVTSAAFFYCLAQVQARRDGPGLAAHDGRPDAVARPPSAASAYTRTRIAPGVWWLAAGIAAGLGLLSKFSALFLGAGTLFWLIVDARQRPWLRSPWPYLGAVLALLIFSPNLVWQSQHHWETFLFQFGRVGGGHFTLRYLGEFLAAQMGLATPFLFVLMLVGLGRGTRRDSRLLLPAILVWTGTGYFLVHALHDRVQGNWPCFLFPALAILAADAFSLHGWRRWVSLLAAPLAALLLLGLYVQALFMPLHLPKDPLARILGRDFRPVGEIAAVIVRSHLADAIVTTDYETTAWLRWDQPDVKVVQINEPQRYPDAPAAPAALLKGQLLYIAELRRDQHQLVQQAFGYSGFPTQLQTPTGLYMLYPIGRPKTSQIGKMP